MMDDIPVKAKANQKQLTCTDDATIQARKQFEAYYKGAAENNGDVLPVNILSQLPLISHELFEDKSKLRFAFESLNKLAHDVCQKTIRPAPKMAFSVATVKQGVECLLRSLKMEINSDCPSFMTSGDLIEMIISDYKRLFRYFCQTHLESLTKQIERTRKLMRNESEKKASEVREKQEPQKESSEEEEESRDLLTILAIFLEGKSLSNSERINAFIAIESVELYIEESDVRNYSSVDSILETCSLNIEIISGLINKADRTEKTEINDDLHKLNDSEVIFLFSMLARFKNLLASSKEMAKFEKEMEKNDKKEGVKADSMKLVEEGVKRIVSRYQSAGKKENVMKAFLEEIRDFRSKVNVEEYTKIFVLEALSKTATTSVQKRKMMVDLVSCLRNEDSLKEATNIFMIDEVFSYLVIPLGSCQDPNSILQCDEDFEDEAYIEFIKIKMLDETTVESCEVSAAAFLVEKIRKSSDLEAQTPLSIEFNQYLERFAKAAGELFHFENAIQVMSRTNKLFVWTGMALKYVEKWDQTHFSAVKKPLKLMMRPHKQKSKYNKTFTMDEDVTAKHLFSIEMKLNKIETRLDIIDILIHKIMTTKTEIGGKKSEAENGQDSKDDTLHLFLSDKSIFESRIGFKNEETLLPTNVQSQKQVCFQIYTEYMRVRNGMKAKTGQRKPQELESFENRMYFSYLFNHGINHLMDLEMRKTDPKEGMRKLHRILKDLSALYLIDYDQASKASICKLKEESLKSIRQIEGQMGLIKNMYRKLEAMDLDDSHLEEYELAREVYSKLSSLKKLTEANQSKTKTIDCGNGNFEKKKSATINE